MNQEALNKNTASLNRLGILAFGKKKTTEQATLKISPNAKEGDAHTVVDILCSVIWGGKTAGRKGQVALLLTPTRTG